MPRFFLIAILCISCVASFCQSPKLVKSPSDAEGLLTKTKALYDTPFRSGLISFSCEVNFDFAEHIKSNFGDNARTDSPIARLLEPIRYRIFARSKNLLTKNTNMTNSTNAASISSLTTAIRA